MRNEEFMADTSDDLTWKQVISLSHAGLQIPHDKEEAFVMLNGVKHLRCVHVDVHEILRFFAQNDIIL